MNNMYQNPWAGLASYEDPAKSVRKLKFCGRDNDIYDVCRLIDDNLLLVLYGKSGIGKTSLLNAGVFPKLRHERYLPISIRLGTLDSKVSFQQAIVSAIENALREAQGDCLIFNVVEEQQDEHSSGYFWNYFARRRFVNDEGHSLFPVIVLDQFEEVLRYSFSDADGKANALLNQLQYLVDENHVLSDCIVDGQEYFYDFNFRFVISIREDELYLLEDSIDNLALGTFRNCRYRLRSLSEQGAEAAILIPGEDCIIEDQKKDVVKRIIELSKRNERGEIDTLLLSMVCSGSYDKKEGEKISLSDLAIWKDNPMEVYYHDAIRSLTADQIRYVQQQFIREDGSRKRVDANKVKAALGESSYSKLIQGTNRLFALGDKGQVELLHDQLGMAVYEERKAFEERERKKKLRRRVILIGLIVLAVAVGFSRQKRRITEQKERITIQNEEILKNNSRLLNDSIIMAAQMDSIKNRDALIVLQQDSINNTNVSLERVNTE